MLSLVINHESDTKKKKKKKMAQQTPSLDTHEAREKKTKNRKSVSIYYFRIDLSFACNDGTKYVEEQKEVKKKKHGCKMFVWFSGLTWTNPLLNEYFITKEEKTNNNNTFSLCNIVLIKVLNVRHTHTHPNTNAG